MSHLLNNHVLKSIIDVNPGTAQVQKFKQNHI